tara:strand:- start:1744 stop:2982 length:1239 start_codon:yes stop_codon:yes gene_type:complete
MKKLLLIIIISLLWCNFGVASEPGKLREIGTDQKCFDLYKKNKIFEKKFLPKAKTKELGGVLVTYVGCNKYYDDWSYDYSTHPNLDRAHHRAYNGCVTTEMKKYNLTGCHLFSIDDVIVWGKSTSFVINLENEIRNKFLKNFEYRKFLFVDPYNNRKVFKPYDPSTLTNIIFNKKRKIAVKIPKGKSKKGRWYLNWVSKNHKSFSFIAEYENDIKLEILIEYDSKLMKDENSVHKEMVKAEMKAKYFAKMFGQMPYFVKRYTKKIFIHGPDKSYTYLWWVPWGKLEFHGHEIKCGEEYWLEKDKAYQIKLQTDYYHNCAQTMLHELAHVLQRNTSVISPSKWKTAKKLDKHYCTKYAMTNDAEDFAESLTCWIGVRYKANKMSKNDVKAVQKLMKNRIKFFDELNLSTHPLK